MVVAVMGGQVVLEAALVLARAAGVEFALRLDVVDDAGDEQQDGHGADGQRHHHGRRQAVDGARRLRRQRRRRHACQGPREANQRTVHSIKAGVEFQ